MTTITPTQFAKVDYDAGALTRLFDRARELVPGVPADLAVELRIDEERATTTARVVGRDPWVLQIDGGAVEDTQRPRTVSDNIAMVAFCRLLFEISDRLDTRFGGPDIGEPSDPALRAGWDTYCVGRTSRRGPRVHQPKYRYNFRNRVGFTDAADDAFDRLWLATSLTWPELEALVSDVAAPKR